MISPFVVALRFCAWPLQHDRRMLSWFLALLSWYKWWIQLALSPLGFAASLNRLLTEQLHPSSSLQFSGYSGICLPVGVWNGSLRLPPNPMHASSPLDLLAGAMGKAWSQWKDHCPAILGRTSWRLARLPLSVLPYQGERDQKCVECGHESVFILKGERRERSAKGMNL